VATAVGDPVFADSRKHLGQFAAVELKVPGVQSLTISYSRPWTFNLVPKPELGNEVLAGS